jgi:hypothetical protein
LADEYLRIGYHGIRAWVKSFNAALQTNYDKGIGKINVVLQEIGCVLLNLFNNASYAVYEQAKKLGSDYELTIPVSTKRFDDRI